MRLHRSLTCGAFFLLATLAATIQMPAEATAQGEKSAGVRCVAVEGALLTQTAKGQWVSVAAKSDVPAEKLLVALFGAEFNAPGGGVNARVVADVGQRGPFPVLEAALRFHAAKSADLEVTLERGILILTNAKKSGAAKIRLNLRAETFEIELHEPKARLGIEVYGRHAPGPPNLKDPKADDPVANIAFFALAGESVVTTEKHATRLHAPPGAALYLWDNVTRTGEVVRFETLPDSAKPMDAEERKKFEAICGFAKSWAAEPGDITKVLGGAVAKPDARERKAAVVALGALDDLPGLMRVFNNKDHADARDTAIVVVRHWLGREPGQWGRLYNYLTNVESNTPTQAKNLIYLFNGLEAEKRQQPETYQLLIEALNHKKMRTRELARWHLVRLAPDGKSIAYDAASGEAQRLEAIAAWRRLIPEGELPPPPKKSPPK
jgi:hypothetical protein